MTGWTELTLSGSDSLAAATLLQRCRAIHPTAGLYEAADLQWWWRVPRFTDHTPQLFWFDGDGSPAAAVVATEWADGVAFDPIVLPGADAAAVAGVIARALSHTAELGFSEFRLEADPADERCARRSSTTGARSLAKDSSKPGSAPGCVRASAPWPTATPAVHAGTPATGPNHMLNARNDHRLRATAEEYLALP